MAFSNFHKTIVNISEKLGLNEDPIVKKSEEFLMSYSSKPSLKNLNDNAIAVLCLDLAATHLGVGFDSETALKTSGLKKSVYRNSLNNMEKILNLDKPLTIGELCVQFSCTVVKDTAENIYSKYKDNNSMADFNHPQYATIAVYTACKLKKFKVQKSQFIAISRLKPSQWTKLESDFDKFAESLGLQAEPKAKHKKTANEFNKYLEDYAKEKENEALSSKPKDGKGSNEQIEDYEVWKQRILEEAKAALGIK